MIDFNNIPYLDKFIEHTLKTDKTLKSIEEIFSLFENNSLTYKEIEKVLDIILAEIKFRRQSLEYDNVYDLLKDKKSYNADNDSFRVCFD